MRYIILVKANAQSEAGVMPPDSLFAEMGRYHEELARAGVLLDGNGLHPTSKGFRIRYQGARRVIDGPFAESKELIAGYTLIQVRSHEEAVEWARRFPNPTIDGSDCEIEVRRLFELDDFGNSAEVDRFRTLQADLAAGKDT